MTSSQTDSKNDLRAAMRVLAVVVLACVAGKLATCATLVVLMIEGMVEVVVITLSLMMSATFV